ncbi:TetR/AcrR family transcriptional regulator [Roseibium sp. Sym1]|uniref:TetR/AcrR family transcriptional regulator n=1 Tax=Roseibium sp. Sym1 TaxID=3016006 RepID=UPI0022B4AFDC|nr:TetR/AcrR family transcriptional regulator [Roseibium sp. Sym1]
MPRPRTHTPDTLARKALPLFWQAGYHATSMDDLVKATGVSRHGIYSDFGGKHALFLACFERYQSEVVSPAFTRVEQPGARLKEVAAYFEQQIARAETTGLPGPGCLVANSATEVAPHDSAVLDKVEQHNNRLRSGFLNALENSRAGTSTLGPGDIAHLAETLLVFATGLWSLSRVTSSADTLRAAVETFLATLERQLK